MARILQITDPHILPEGVLAYGQVDTGGALALTVETINAALPRIGPIDLVVVTGDLTDHGTAEEYARFKSIMAELTIGYVAIPGNHDDRDQMRAAFAGTQWMPPEGDIRWRMDVGDLTVLGLDTLVPSAPYGALSQHSLDWLRTQIATLDGRPLIVALHHPPVETGITQMDRQRLQRPAELETALGGYSGPCRIIAGHVHRLVFDTLGAVPVVIAPGTSHAVTLDLQVRRAGTFDMEPPGVLIHDSGTGEGKGDGKGIRTHLMPIGAFGGPHPFARRP
jgi:Icc protein